MLACRAATNITSSVVSALSLESSVTSRKLQQLSGVAGTIVRASAGRLRRLQASLADEGDTVASTLATTTTITTNLTSMVVYDIAAASTTSSAITVKALTFGQAQLLLTDATATFNEVLAIAAVAVCGNGVCELGERPNATAAGVNATGTHWCAYTWTNVDSLHIMKPLLHIGTAEVGTALLTGAACLSSLETPIAAKPHAIPYIRVSFLPRVISRYSFSCLGQSAPSCFRPSRPCPTPHFLAAGGCPEDCFVPYVVCPIPTGSLSMCGGTPRGQCMTSSGECTCNTGYSGVDCGKCALGYSREGMRCVLASESSLHCALPPPSICLEVTPACCIWVAHGPPLLVLCSQSILPVCVYVCHSCNVSVLTACLCAYRGQLVLIWHDDC